MSRGSPVTIYDFFRGDVPVANLAGQLLTESFPARTIWAEESYGSELVSLLRRQGDIELLRREIERVLELVPGDGELLSLDSETTVIVVANAEIAITDRGAFYPWQS